MVSLVTSVQYLSVLKDFPGDRSLANLVRHWNELTRSLPDERFVVDLEGIESERVRADMGKIILASGHFLAGQVRDEPIVLGQLAVTDLVLSETIFVDTETDMEKRRDYLEKYSAGLRSIAQMKIPIGTVHIHVTYCSVDKVEDIVE